MEEITLRVEHLCTTFFTDNGEIKAVNDVSLEVPAGKIVGIVGESGCGKSMTARSVMSLVRYPGKVVSGDIVLDGRNLSGLSAKERRAVCGDDISMIFQEPMTSLNPVVRIGPQVQETLRIHKHLPKEEAKKKTIEMLESVGIPDPETRYSSYPHQLSGGLRQRVLIAMAMICSPKLLIADEPTTALDVTVEAQILRLMKGLCDRGTSILLISHNLGVIAQVCDYVYVMYAGRIVEQADTLTLFDHPCHPYTKGLLESVSSLRSGVRKLDTIPGTVPDLRNLPEGCSFSPRCAKCMQTGEDETVEKCRNTMPQMVRIGPGHSVRCHLFDEMPVSEEEAKEPGKMQMEAPE